jgi:hypothetical protein
VGLVGRERDDGRARRMKARVRTERGTEEVRRVGAGITVGGPEALSKGHFACAQGHYGGGAG